LPPTQRLSSGLLSFARESRSPPTAPPQDSVSDTVLAAVLPQDGSCPGRRAWRATTPRVWAVWPPPRQGHARTPAARALDALWAVSSCSRCRPGG
jgi:hypothetical protein